MGTDKVFSDAWIFQGRRGFVRGDLCVAGGRIREVCYRGDDGTGRCAEGIAPEMNACEEGYELKAGASELKAEASVPETGDMHCGKGPGTYTAYTAAERISLQGFYVIPGLVDIHTHGNSGYDFSDASQEGLAVIGRYMAAHGITSFLPTSMTLPYDRLEAAFQTAVSYRENPPENGARVLGIHMEGPYFSEKRKGAQNREYLKLPDTEGFLGMQERCGGLIRIVDVAPELEGAEDFIRAVSPFCKVSVAHTDASYEDAVRAFDAGASHVTHLFNAMPSIHHRDPGVIPAAAQREDVAAELICDGLHVHPSVVRMAFKLFPGRICLISDSLRCCGMPEGEYELGGQIITLKDGQARIADGNLAGAARNLYEDMVNAIHYGVKAEDAILAATMNPAREAGAEDEVGSLDVGRMADFLVCDRDWNLKRVYMGGVQVG